MLDKKDAMASSGIETMKVKIADLNKIENPEVETFTWGDKEIKTEYDLEIAYKADKLEWTTNNSRQMRVKNWNKQFYLSDYEGKPQVNYSGGFDNKNKDLIAIIKLYEKAGNEVPHEFNLNDLIGFEFDARVVHGSGTKGAYLFIDWLVTFRANDIAVPQVTDEGVRDPKGLLKEVKKKEDVFDDTSEFGF